MGLPAGKGGLVAGVRSVVCWVSTNTVGTLTPKHKPTERALSASFKARGLRGLRGQLSQLWRGLLRKSQPWQPEETDQDSQAVKFRVNGRKQNFQGEGCWEIDNKQARRTGLTVESPGFHLQYLWG